MNVPLDLPYTMPADYTLQVGRGVTLRTGTDVAIIGYGPMLLTNAWRAADELAKQGISAAVIDLPWLNRIDDEWVKTLGALRPHRHARQSLSRVRPGRDGRRRARAHRRARRSCRRSASPKFRPADRTPTCWRITASMPPASRAAR